MLLQGGFFIFGVKSRGPLTPVRKSYNHPDPLEPQPHDVDVKALLRIAAVYNIPIACNRATADFLISSHLMNEQYERIVVDYDLTQKTRNDLFALDNELQNCR